MLDIDKIRDRVQESIDSGFEELDLPDYIDACDDLSDEEKEWALNNLGVHIEVDIF